MSTRAWPTGAFLERLAHVWVENPLMVLRFWVDTVLSVPRLLAEFGSRRAGAFLLRILKQAAKAVFRGLALAAAVGVVAGLGLGALGRSAGALTRPLLDEVLMVVVLRDLLPVAVALVVAARAGSAVATKLALRPTTGMPHWATPFPWREVAPHLFAGGLSAPVFHLLIAFAAVAGYLAAGEWLPSAASETIAGLSGTWGEALGSGLVRSAVFGVLAISVAAALGTASAERRGQTDRIQYEPYRPAWESTVTSVLAAAIITLFLWSPP